MLRGCSIALTGCPGVDSPITNISSEAPDPVLFWGQIWDPYDPYRPIPLGPDQYVDVGCDDLLHEIFSIYDPIVYAETQVLANLKAQAEELGCIWPETPVPVTSIYTNEAQTATVYCADGSAFSYTVDAGTVVSPPLDAEFGAAWLIWANAWAESYALEQATLLQACLELEVDGGTDLPPGGPGDNPPTPPTPPSGGLISGVIWVCRDDELYKTYRVSGSGLTQFVITIAEGTVPPGTVFLQTSSRSVTVSGFPNVPGAYQFKLHAQSAVAPLIVSESWATIFVFGLTETNLPNGTPGTPYTQVLTAAGGTAPYTYALSDDSDPLPDGITLSADGTLSGTPTTEETSNFTVTVTDANGGQCDQDCDLTIGNCPDWSTLAWTTAVQSNGSFWPTNDTGASFSAVTLGLPFDVYNIGGLTYNGSGCDCKIHITYTGPIVPFVPPNQQCLVSVFIPSPFQNLTCWPAYVPGNPGSYDVLFSIPDTGGADVQILVLVQMQSVPGACTFSGEVMNV